MKYLIDVVLLLIIALCIWSGYRKGLIMGVGGIVAILIAVYGGSLLSGAYSGEVIPAFRPFISGYIEGQIDEKVVDELGLDDSEYSLEDLLKDNEALQKEFASASFRAMGIYSRTADQLAEEALTYVADNEDVSIQSGVIEVLCQRMTYAFAFILAFLLILIVLVVVGNIPNLTYKIPNMDTLNNVGGLITGILRGLLLCSVLVWALKFLGLVLGDALEHTILARLLLRVNFLTLWIGL